ncbi:MAG: NRDE family protein [Halanaeroarchaeum sp.]
MCTIVLAWQEFERTPVAVAANRDESPDRPSSPPQTVDGEPRILMPRDERAGGTWMGVNEHRLFAIVANRWNDAALDAERSRGLLVADVLSAKTVVAAESVLETALAEHEYDGFSLLVASPSAAKLFLWDGEFASRSLDPGVHVIVNVGFDGTYDVPESRRAIGDRQTETADRLQDRLQTDHGESSEEWLDRAGTALGDHDVGACIHHERYQTVSSSLVAIGAEGAVDWRYADGPPCTAAFRPVDGQI